MVIFAIVLLVVPLLLLLLFLDYRRRHSSAGTENRQTVKVCIILGSGGHTTEMIALLEHLKPNYTPRLYLVAKSDSLSLEKIKKFEENRKDGSYDVYTISRSREVLQSYFTSVFTTLRAFWESLHLVLCNKFDLLICNGPGTCIPVCIAVALFDFLRLRDTKIIYFESICRVKQLSASGLILYYLGIPDLIAVHWLDIVEKYPKTKLINNLGVNY